MNTYTILNVKTDKELKSQAKEIAKELGVPLSTVVNAFLKQFVREKSITLSASPLKPSAYLKEVIKEAEHDFETGNVQSVDSVAELVAELNR